MTERKLTKVIMEYDNGDRHYIDGNDVDKWRQALDSCIVLSHVHGSDVQKVLNDIVWKKID